MFVQVRKPSGVWGVMDTIPLDHPELDHIRREIIRPEYHARAWVAGSAATRQGYRGDIDIWIVDQRGVTLDPTHYIQPAHVQPAHELNAIEEYANGLWVYRTQALHVFATHQSIDAILSHFDISLHAGARALDREEYRVAETFDEVVLRVNPSCSRRASSMRRALDLVERYQLGDHALTEPSIQRLAVQVFGLPAKWRLLPEGF